MTNEKRTWVRLYYPKPISPGHRHVSGDPFEATDDEARALFNSLGGAPSQWRIVPLEYAEKARIPRAHDGQTESTIVTIICARCQVEMPLKWPNPVCAACLPSCLPSYDEKSRIREARTETPSEAETAKAAVRQIRLRLPVQRPGYGRQVHDS